MVEAAVKTSAIDLPEQTIILSKSYVFYSGRQVLPGRAGQTLPDVNMLIPAVALPLCSVF